MSTKNPSLAKSDSIVPARRIYGRVDFRGHHSYLILGAGGNGVASLKKAIKRGIGFEPEGNPDYWEKQVETFGIEDSRELKGIDLGKPFRDGGRKVIVIKTEFITSEAQNALLKILEDPNSNSSFFFLMPSKEDLLPTLLSRFLVLEDFFEDDKSEVENKSAVDVNLFLNLSIPARLKSVSKIVATKDKKIALLFVEDLERYFFGKKGDWRGRDAWSVAFALDLLEKSRRFLKIRGGSMKLVLENLCLNLPKI